MTAGVRVYVSATVSAKHLWLKCCNGRETTCDGPGATPQYIPGTHVEHREDNLVSSLARILTVLLAISASDAAVAQGAARGGASPFPQLAGSWTGGGQARFEDGKSERLSCRAYYTPKDASGMGLAIRCASTSYKIEIRSNLKYEAGGISGSWEERTFNAEGVVTGKAGGGNINLTITGGGLNGTMAVSYGGSNQTVAINTTGIGLKGVQISMNRD